MKRKIIVADSAGFCFGVKRAVELAQKTAGETNGCWMLGDLIHNTHVVEDATSVSVLLTDNRSLLDEVSEFLLVKETITGDELMAYVNADKKDDTQE